MQRPTAVTVFGILNIVFAALGIFGVLASVMLFAVVEATSRNPLVKLIHESPFFAAWMKLSIVLGLAAAAALLAAGIGLLKLQPWARALSITYAIYAIIMVLIGMAINFIFLTRPMLD
ncbi:MAG: hypothetical protein KGJ60_03175 [Verrucomicrobiota bacterium]|nr:hypothetical protein [Verrucomicrobiota bacterium]